MKVLAIETSCDETGIALVEGQKIEGGFEFKTLKSTLLSQAALHAPYGGVFPNLAKREHQKNLPILWEEISSPPGDDISQIDAIAVTEGPGLEPALWQGIEFAKKLAAQTGKPLFGINHMEGHLLSSLATKNHSDILENTGMVLKDINFPVLGLLISGGHTEFVLMSDWFEYKIVGQTLDDAVGEAFDKVARMLELPYPGGPEISKLADEARLENKISNIELPRPMLQSKNCDVSFSGLKTAALYALRDKKLNDDEKAAFAREFEDAVTDVFIAKTRKALEESGAKMFVIGGGVAANRFIREQLQKLLSDEFPNVEMRLPEISITGDNAIMIAQAALLRLLSGKQIDTSLELRAVGNLSISSQK